MQEGLSKEKTEKERYKRGKGRFVQFGNAMPGEKRALDSVLMRALRQGLLEAL